MNMNQYTPLFRIVLKFFKYFLLTMFGFLIAYIVSASLGVSHIIAATLPLVLIWCLRLGIILLFLLLMAVVLESLR